MGDEVKKSKIQVGILDDPIDILPDFKGIEFYQPTRPSLEEFEEGLYNHGTHVFGVFYRTLDSVADHFNQHLKVINIYYSDLVGFNQDPSYEDYIKKINKRHNKALNQVLSYPLDILNLSLTFSLADFGVHSALSSSKHLFQQKRQNGTFIVAAAGNDGGVISANDIFPQNDLYVFTVGAVYWQKSLPNPQKL